MFEHNPGRGRWELHGFGLAPHSILIRPSPYIVKVKASSATSENLLSDHESLCRDDAIH